MNLLVKKQLKNVEIKPVSAVSARKHGATCCSEINCCSEIKCCSEITCCSEIR